MDNKANVFLNWLVINVLLPLLPVIIKLMLTIFANTEKISVTILDSVELLYYNLFISVIYFNLEKEKNTLTLFETFIQYCIVMVIIVDLILITLNYVKLASNRCSVVAIILSVVIPIFVSVYKWKSLQEVEHEKCI